MQLSSIKPPLAILLFMVSFPAVGAVLFTPALPTISAFFQLSEGEVQLTVTSYLLGYALGQLPYGPLANRFGRKVTLFMGITLAIIGSFLCALSSPINSFSLLIVARFFQALGASVGLKISFTMIADAYEKREATVMISRLLIALAVIPGLAIAVGGWLTSWVNWESCFYFQAFYGFFVLWLSTKMPETAKTLDSQPLKLDLVFRGYSVKFKNPRIVLSGLLWGCASSVLYIFAAKAPFIGISLMGLSPDIFGLYNLISVLGSLMGAILSINISGRVSFFVLVFWGILISLVSTIAMLIPFGLDWVTPGSLFLPMLPIYIALFVIVPNVSSYGLAHAKDKSNGSAVLSFVNLGMTVVAVFLSEWLYPRSAIFLPLSFTLAFSIMLVLWLRLKKLEVVPSCDFNK